MTIDFRVAIVRRGLGLEKLTFDLAPLRIADAPRYDAAVSRGTEA